MSVLSLVGMIFENLRDKHADDGDAAMAMHRLGRLPTIENLRATGRAPVLWCDGGVYGKSMQTDTHQGDRYTSGGNR